MRLTGAFFANHAEVVDDMLNVTGGCWTSTTVADGSTAFGTRCVMKITRSGSPCRFTFKWWREAPFPNG